MAAIEYGPDNGFNVDDLQTAERLNNVSVTDIHHIIDRYEGSDVESQLDMQMMAINLGDNSDVWYWNNDKWLYSLAIDMFNNQTIPDVISIVMVGLKIISVQLLHVEILPLKTM